MNIEVLVDGRHSWTQAHVLRVADISDPDRLNPYLSTMDMVYNLTSLMYSYLVIADNTGRLIGDLAVSVPTLANGGISPDGRTYTYHLHRNVRWHDGVAFTSHDVVRSWQAVVDPRNNTLHREGYDRVSSIDAPDAYTVVVHLKHRYPPFVTQFFAPLQEGGKPILPAHILDKERDFNTGALNALPVGTGPFQFVRWDRGNEIVLRRFDAYFKGRPKLSRIEVHIIADDNTILTQLQVHQIDMIDSPPSALFERFRAVHDVLTTLLPWNAQSVLIFNSRRPGLHEVAVRRAIAEAIDYKGIIDNITHGVGEMPYNSLPPTAIGYERLPPHHYDPAAANRTLDAAGWLRGGDGIRQKNGARLSLVFATVRGSSNGQAIAVQLQSYLRAVGIDMPIRLYPYDQMFAIEGPIYGTTYDLASYSTTLTWDPNILFYFGCDQWYPHGENVYGYCNPALDELEKRGLEIDDPAQRAGVYRAASRIIWEDVPYLPLYQLRRLSVYSADLRGFSVNPSATPWWNAWQWDI
jgi:peptide/nickel transport system substrate-binding protein